MANLDFPEILIIAFVVLILLGVKKIPEIAKGIGAIIKDFRREFKSVKKESVKN